MFAAKMKKDNWIKAEPVKLELVKNSENLKNANRATAQKCQINLRMPADVKEGKNHKNIKIMVDLAGRAATSSKIKEKVTKVFLLYRDNGITLNSNKFKVSRTIEVGDFKIVCKDDESTPEIRPTKMAVNRILYIKASKNKKEVQRYIGPINTIFYWIKKVNASCPNLKALAGSKTEWTRSGKLQEDF